METIFQSNTPGNYTQTLLANNYYEIVCVGGGGGSSYGAGGAGACWIGIVKPTTNTNVELLVGSGGAGAIPYARNHCGSKGERSSVIGTDITIICSGGEPGIAARISNCMCDDRSTHSKSHTPEVSINFDYETTNESTYQTKRSSWIENETYGEGGFGGYSGKGRGASGKDGFIKIVHIGESTESYESEEEMNESADPEIYAPIEENYEEIDEETDGNTVLTKNTFKAESRLVSVDLNGRPVQEKDLEEAFLSCIRLENLENVVDSIENLDSAFEGCTALKKVPQIPLECTSMKNTFKNCVSFNSSVIIPRNVTNIEGCFNGCKSLAIEPIFIHKNLITSLKDTFKNTSLQIAPETPYSVQNFEEAFYDCKKLKSCSSIYLTNAVNLKKTFYNCVNLLSIPTYIHGNITNMCETFYNCPNIDGTIIDINCSEITDAKDCFFVPNKTVKDRNVWLPIPSTTYQSFTNAGYSQETRKHGVLLINRNHTIVNFEIQSNNKDIENLEGCVVEVTYDGHTYPCINTLDTHENHTCISGCKKNIFYAIIPNNKANVTVHVSLSTFEDYTQQFSVGTEYIINKKVELIRLESEFVATVKPMKNSTIAIYENDMVEPVVGETKRVVLDENNNLIGEILENNTAKDLNGNVIGTLDVNEEVIKDSNDKVVGYAALGEFYEHLTGETLTMRCYAENTSLLSNEKIIEWNTDFDSYAFISLEIPKYTPGQVLYESNTENETGTLNLYKNYIYEMTCVGGGGGSSYGAGGAGSMWKGNIHVDRNVTINMLTGAKGNPAGPYCRNHCGGNGGISKIVGDGISIIGNGGYPGIAARGGNCSCRSGSNHSKSPAPSVEISFADDVIFSNVYQQRRESYISGTNYGAGANGGHNGKGWGGTGSAGYIKICYTDKEKENEIGTIILEKTDNIVTQECPNPRNLSEGLYRITSVGAGGGSIFFKEPGTSNVYYKASGGSGSSFEATVYLKEGNYTWHVGEGGTSAHVTQSDPSATNTDGGNTTLVLGEMEITSYGGKKATVIDGAYIGGAGGELCNPSGEKEKEVDGQVVVIPGATVYEMIFNNVGNDGSSDVSDSKTLNGGESTYENHGIGGSVLNANAIDGTNGYLRIVKIDGQ